MKKSTMKKVALTSLVAAFSVVLGASVSSLNVSADTAYTAKTVEQATSVAMAKGASARINADGKNGLRYTLEVSTADYKGLRMQYGTDIQFGILIAPDSYNTANELNAENVFGEEAVYDWATMNDEGNWVYEGTKTQIINLSATALAADESNPDKYVLYGTISNLNESNYAVEFRGVGYVAYKEGETTKYKFLENNDNVRSMAYVAQVYQTLDSVSAEDKATVLSTYITGKADQVDTTYTVNHMLSDGNGGYTVGEAETVTAKINAKTDAPVAKTFTGYTFDEANANNSAGDTLVYANGKTEALNLYYLNNTTRLMNKDGNTYTPATNALNFRSAFAYTNPETYSDTVVYSVKVSAPEGVHRYYGQPPQLGITLKTQTPLTEIKTAHNLHSTQWGDAPSIQLGLTDCGIWSTAHAISGGNARRMDTVETDRWNTTTVNPTAALKGVIPTGTDANGTINTESTVTERTFTVALYKDTLYMYVDGVYVCKVAVTNANYYEAAYFAAGQKYTFGVQMTNINTATTKNPSVTFLEAKYGEEALTEIKTNNLYKYSIITPLAVNATKNVDGSYTQAKDWFNYSYAYTSTNFSDTVVYKTQITTTATDMVSCNNGIWRARVGIVFTNGNTIGASTFTDRNGGSRNCGDNWLSNGMVSLCLGPSEDVRKFMAVGSGPDRVGAAGTNFKMQYLNLGTSEAFTNVTMTTVLYKGTIYVYLNDVFKFSISLDDALFDWTNVNGEVKEMKSTDKLIFGTGALLVKDATTTKELQYLTDAEALAEITAKYSAQITVE